MELFLSRFKRWHFILVLILMQILSHFTYLKLPAVGNHVWRQCNTLAVARNYYQEDMNILYPRIDKRLYIGVDIQGFWIFSKRPQVFELNHWYIRNFGHVLFGSLLFSKSLFGIFMQFLTHWNSRVLLSQYQCCA